MIRRTPSRASRSCLAAVALAVASSACHGATPAEREAAAIAEKNAAARGGLEAWRAVRALSLSGKLEAGRPRNPVKLAMAYARPKGQGKADARRSPARAGEAGQDPPTVLPFVLEMKRPRKTRLEVRFQGKTAVQVFDGKAGWKVRPFLGRHEVEPYTAEELRAAAQQTELDGPLVDYAAKGSRLALLGTEPVDGRDAYKLEVTTEKGEVRHVWVDTQTFLDVKVDATRRMDGKLRPVWTSLRDYRPVDGLMIPHLLETTVEGVPGAEKVMVERVAVNPTLDEGRFARPD